MSSGTADASPSDLPKASSASTAGIHPRWVRITHWVNVIAMFVMIASGWRIYDASPLFRFTFPPEITLGDGLQDALLWHFAAMWLLAINGVAYLTLGIFSGRFRRKLWPIRPPDVIRDLRDALYRYPVEVSIWQALGDAYMRANRLQDALDAYTKAEELLR